MQYSFVRDHYNENESHLQKSITMQTPARSHILSVLHPQLRHGDIDIWHVDIGAANWPDTASHLQADERETMTRYRTARLQLHYERCRSALRMVLARYLTCQAASIVFDYDKGGKPRLRGAQLQFNVSHSDGHALIAVSCHRLGIDIERPRAGRIDIAALLPDVCHASELAPLAALRGSAQEQVFYRHWTRKEAYLKAIGTGLHQSMPELRFAERGGVAMVIDEARAGPTPFFVFDVEVKSPFYASVCVPIDTVHLRQVEFVPGVFS
jgi:4'-phosphopantetheinyl transferase